MKDIRTFIESKFSREIRQKRVEPSVTGECVSLPHINDSLRLILEEDGISSLYVHQRAAYDAIIGGQHTLLVSNTASGKTLAFFLPILNSYSEAAQPFTTLFLYPTKALSRDQEGTFGRLMSVVKKSGKLGTFDGDTPQNERSRIQRSADFIITNPDMLHSGILPNHNRQWKDMLSRLKYVVVDEVHAYRGAFGSHVGNVFRRLQRICSLYGSDPVFVCSSATIGNPGDHVSRLFGRDFTVIDTDTSPRPERVTYFCNPSLVKSHGHALYRKGPGSLSVPLIREATRLGVRTIVFCRARQEVERLYRAVVDGHESLARVVQPYRGGLLPNERRALERDLASGKLITIISTNALELGIDIGGLDLCILQGHPGTLASFRQQAGRVGRSGRDATVVYVAKDSPMDQYLVHHPDYISSRSVESARTSVNNPYILLQHLPCAAHEYPLAVSEELFPEPVYSRALQSLIDEKLLVPYRDAYRYGGRDFPTRGVNLRGLTDYNVEIYAGTEVIGEIDPVGARGELFKDAIYQHLGKKYMSMELDLEKKLCRVEPVNVDYYTEAHWERRIDMADTFDTKNVRGARAAFGGIVVNKQPKLYKKIRERTLENIGYGPITLPPFEYVTTGFSFLVPEDWGAVMAEADVRIIGAALYGLGYILRHAGPMLTMADVRDVETDVALALVTENSWESSLHFYDRVDGGVGFSEEIYDRFSEALELCRTIIAECECATGCPACVPPLPPGVESDELEDYFIETDAARQALLSLLKALLHGEVVVPVITSTRHELVFMEEGVEYDEHAVLDSKLNRAAGMLKKKRERLH